MKYRPKASLVLFYLVMYSAGAALSVALIARSGGSLPLYGVVAAWPFVVMYLVLFRPAYFWEVGEGEISVSKGSSVSFLNRLFGRKATYRHEELTRVDIRMYGARAHFRRGGRQLEEHISQDLAGYEDLIRQLKAMLAKRGGDQVQPSEATGSARRRR